MNSVRDTRTGGVLGPHAGRSQSGVKTQQGASAQRVPDGERRESRAQTRRRAPALNPLLCDVHSLPRVQLDTLCPRNGPASQPSLGPCVALSAPEPGPLQAGDGDPAGSPGTPGHRDDRSGPGTTAPVGSPPRLCRRRRRPAVRASEAVLTRSGLGGRSGRQRARPLHQAAGKRPSGLGQK